MAQRRRRLPTTCVVHVAEVVGDVPWMPKALPRASRTFPTCVGVGPVGGFGPSVGDTDSTRTRRSSGSASRGETRTFYDKEPVLLHVG